MLVFVTAALQLLVYLCAVPVNLAIRLDDADGLRFGSGLSIFDRGAARRRATRRLGEKGRGKTPGLRTVLRILRRLHVDRISLSGRVCLGDAALTAVACGGMTAAARGLSVRSSRSRVDLRPDFSSTALHLELRGMLCFHAGQIILALLRAGINSLERRVRTWTDIRSKAS